MQNGGKKFFLLGVPQPPRVSTNPPWQVGGPGSSPSNPGGGRGGAHTPIYSVYPPYIELLVVVGKHMLVSSHQLPPSWSFPVPVGVGGARTSLGRRWRPPAKPHRCEPSLGKLCRWPTSGCVPGTSTPVPRPLREWLQQITQYRGWT